MWLCACPWTVRRCGRQGGEWRRQLAAGLQWEPVPQSSCASLQDDEQVSEFALDGLKQVMAVKSRVVLPYLVPKVHPHTWHTLHPRASCACPSVGSGEVDAVSLDAPLSLKMYWSRPLGQCRAVGALGSEKGGLS